VLPGLEALFVFKSHSSGRAVIGAELCLREVARIVLSYKRTRYRRRFKF
jgi:hypothetical protein